ncbi:hypothetical protein COD21_24520 [Bacillus cereus]|uniref:phage antirepressor KilAC domain-containing protein n=1 Tax=Bacillus cereus TaxID=1396 RepID=UPI000BFB380C|nr:phage antirepressor KilAC domain-containing protein [Bacillus cereus]PGU06693.1 hypothetical protein COD21_24520 [Bacillus cereus]
MKFRGEKLELIPNFGEVATNQEVKQEVTVTHETDVLTDPQNVAQREKYIERIEVLHRVKGLLLLPQLEMATTRQVATFYGVDRYLINKIIERNHDELKADGLNYHKYSEVAEKVNGQGVNLLLQGVSYRGTYLFPKRAILRIGMLLRDSATAKEVRTQLLNIEKHATNEQRTQEIDKDGLLLLDIIRAKDPIKQAQAIAAYTEYKDARAKEAEEKAAKYEEKAGKFDLVTEKAGLLTLTGVGKSYIDGISANALNKFLIQRGVLYKKKVDGIHMYKKGYEKYFKVVTYEAGYRTLKVTLEGALFIAELYTKHNSEKCA